MRCTKDACENHLCEKCLKCSDCCECEVALEAPAHEPARPAASPVSGEPEIPGAEPEPEPALAADSSTEDLPLGSEPSPL